MNEKELELKKTRKLANILKIICIILFVINALYYFVIIFENHLSNTEEKNMLAYMTEPEIVAYNKKFESYEGTAVKGNDVKILIKEAYIHNKHNKDDSSKQVVVGIVENDSTYVSKGNTDDEINCNHSNIQSQKTYKVKCYYFDNEPKLVSSISIEENGE